MYKILVEYRKKPFYWVDTIVVHDKNELDYPCAVLISAREKPMFVDLDDIVVFGYV